MTPGDLRALYEQKTGRAWDAEAGVLWLCHAARSNLEPVGNFVSVLNGNRWC